MLCKHCIASLLNEDMTDDGVWPPEIFHDLSFHKLQYISKTITITPQMFLTTIIQNIKCSISFPNKVAHLIFCVYPTLTLPGRRIKGGGKAGVIVCSDPTQMFA